MKLYHYVHCPFCVRVRLGLGLLGIKYDSIVLPYNDEITPVRISGVKMLPIFEFPNGEIVNESLVILKKLDTDNKLSWDVLLIHEVYLNQLLSKIGESVHSLCMPYWVWTPEFDSNSRKYFQDKKEVKRGPFKNLILQKESYLNNLNMILQNEVESKLTPFYSSDKLTILDIMLASHLWGMYIFPEFQFSPKMHNYLQSIKALCQFEYHKDFWV